MSYKLSNQKEIKTSDEIRFQFVHFHFSQAREHNCYNAFFSFNLLTTIKTNPLTIECWMIRTFYRSILKLNLWLSLNLATVWEVAVIKLLQKVSNIWIGFNLKHCGWHFWRKKCRVLRSRGFLLSLRSHRAYYSKQHYAADQLPWGPFYLTHTTNSQRNIKYSAFFCLGSSCFIYNEIKDFLPQMR